MALKGNVSDLRNLKKRLKGMPTSVAYRVAQRAAPKLTQNTQRAFNSNRTVYGQARPRSEENGKALDLIETSLTKRELRFEANGTIVRCVLGARYHRYLIGKYKILPMGQMPLDWARDLQQIVEEEAARSL